MSALGTLGRYTLLRRLAAGGMGEVYLAEAQGAANFSRQVAIKRILPHLAQDQDFVAKFIDEANIMVQLHHGNIVGVQELADHDGELYIVMEYLPGRDLKAVIRRLRRERRQMPVDLALWLIAEICAALDYAHRKTGADGQPMGIVHRDVSPSNVVLGAEGEVKLLDFGIARARGRLHQSISGTLQGKFVYMSPEQADGRGISTRSDIYSAGLVLYELITGLRPFEGESETETLRKVRAGVVAPPSTVAEIDPSLDPLVMKALARDPAERYATAADMRRALLHHLADTRSTADGHGFAQFLSSLFPEGLVPQGEDKPLSVDDALQLQLGVLTPSIDAMTRTQTADAASGTPSAPAVNTGPMPSYPGGQILVSGQTPVIVPRQRGLKRVLVVGVVFGAVVATGIMLWVSRRGTARVAPQVHGPTDWSMFAEELPITPRSPLPVGEERRICVRARGYQEACRAVVIERGVNRPAFTLAPIPTLRPQVTPAGIAHTFTANGMRIEEGAQLQAGEHYRVCLSDVQAGWENVDGCREFTANAPVHRPTFELRPDPADAAVEVAARDAGVPPPAKDAAPATRRRPPPPRPTRLRLTAQPVASVRCDDGTTGSTPLTIVAADEAVRCRLSAPGHAELRYTVKPRLGSRSDLVRLPKPALLRIRVEPPAATLLMDGRRMKKNFFKQRPTTPGEHRFEAVLELGGKTYRQAKTVTLAPGANEPILIRIPDVPGVP